MVNNGSSAPTGYVFAYSRVSSVKQNYDRQIADIDGYRDERGNSIPEKRRFAEKISGARMDRPQLNALLDQARPGDRIVVSSLDRLGRTAMQTLQTIERLEQQDITVVSLKPGENFEGHTGKLIRGIMPLVAEWELINTAERAADARAAREARGVEQQRSKNVLKPEKVAEVRRLHATGATKVKIARDLGLSRSSVYRALQDA